jgi:hypothetical protein
VPAPPRLRARLRLLALDAKISLRRGLGCRGALPVRASGVVRVPFSDLRAVCRGERLFGGEVTVAIILVCLAWLERGDRGDGLFTFYVGRLHNIRGLIARATNATCKCRLSLLTICNQRASSIHTEGASIDIRLKSDNTVECYPSLGHQVQNCPNHVFWNPCSFRGHFVEQIREHVTLRVDGIHGTTVKGRFTKPYVSKTDRQR